MGNLNTTLGTTWRSTDFTLVLLGATWNPIKPTAAMSGFSEWMVLEEENTIANMHIRSLAPDCRFVFWVDSEDSGISL